MPNNHLEHEFRQRLGQHSVPVDTDALWAAVEPELPPEPGPRRRLLPWRWLFAGLLLLLAVGLMTYHQTDDSSELAAAAIPTPPQAPEAPAKPVPPRNQPMPAVAGEKLSAGSSVAPVERATRKLVSTRTPSPKAPLVSQPPAPTTPLQPATPSPDPVPAINDERPPIAPPAAPEQERFEPQGPTSPAFSPKPPPVPTFAPVRTTSAGPLAVPYLPLREDRATMYLTDQQLFLSAIARNRAQHQQQAYLQSIKNDKAPRVSATERAAKRRETERKDATDEAEKIARQQAKVLRKANAESLRDQRADATVDRARLREESRVAKRAEKSRRAAERMAMRQRAAEERTAEEAEKTLATRAARELREAKRLQNQKVKRENEKKQKAERKAYYAELREQAAREWEEQVARNRESRKKDEEFFKKAAAENKAALRQQKLEMQMAKAKERLNRQIDQGKKALSKATGKEERRQARLERARQRRAEREARRAARKAEREARRKAKKEKQPKKIRPKKEKFYTAEVYATLGIPNQTGGGSDGGVSEQQLTTRAFGALAGYHRSDGWSLRSGFLYSTLYSKFERTTAQPGFRTEEGVVAIVEGADGSRREQRGSVRIPTETVTRERFYNRRTSVDLPLLAGYRLSENKFGLLIEAGPVLNLSSGGSGRLPSLVALPANYLAGRRAGLGALLNLSGEYQLGEKRSLTLGLRYHLLGGAFENPDVTGNATRYGDFSLQFGYRIKF